MLRKVFKYDFKSLVKQIFPLLFVMLLLGGVSCALSFLSDSLADNMVLLGGLFTSVIVLSVIAIAVLAVVSLVLVFYRYFKSVFTDEGYLTNVLPLSPSELFFGKTLVGCVFIPLTVLVTLIAYLVAFLIYPMVTLGIDPREAWELLDGFLRAFLLGETLFDRITLLTSLLASGFEWIFIIYTAITVGSLTCRRHKMLGSLLFVMILTTVEELVKGSVTLLPLLLPSASGGWLLYMTDSVMSVLIATALCLFTLRLFSKKFNIE